MTTLEPCIEASLNASFLCVSKDPFDSKLKPSDDYIVAAMLSFAWPFALCLNILVLYVGVRFWSNCGIIDALILHLAALDLGKYSLCKQMSPSIILLV